MGDAHKQRSIGAGITLPHACAMSIFTAKGSADRTDGTGMQRIGVFNAEGTSKTAQNELPDWTPDDWIFTWLL